MVLSTRYGDCKDKSNLLRVLLREHGIPSRLVLIDTAHAGQIDQTIPSVGRFDHALLQIDFAEGEPLYCDPTIPHSTLGMLAQGDINRDALLIDANGKTEWNRTPSQSSGTLLITLDCELESGGGFSGWMTLKADGLIAANFTSSMHEKDRTKILEYLQGLQSSGTEVIDYEWIEVTPGKFEIKAYVLKSGSGKSNTTSERVSLPACALLSPIAGTEAIRQTPIYVYQVDCRITAKFHLPKDWKTIDIPTLFEKRAAGAELRANWQAADGELLCTASLRSTKNLIQPAEHGQLWKAKAEWNEWLETPALISKPSAPTPAPGPATSSPPDKSKLHEILSTINRRPKITPTIAPESLPRMASPQGQSALINRRYPFDENAISTIDFPSRRIAYTKAKEYFPDDPEFQFEADIQLLLSDFCEKEDFTAADRAAELIEKNKDKVSSAMITPAQLVMIGGLIASEKFDEAEPLARTLAEDPALSDPMRTVAALHLAAALAYKDKPDFEESLKYTRVALQNQQLPEIGVAGSIFLLFINLAKLPGATPESIAKEYEELARRFPHFVETMSQCLTEVPGELMTEGNIIGLAATAKIKALAVL